MGIIMRVTTIFAAAILMLGTMTPVEAGIVKAKFNGIFPGLGTQGNDFLQYTLDGQSHQNRPGVFNWATQPGSEINLGDKFKTFCIELVQGINQGDIVMYETTSVANAPIPGPAMGAAAADAISALWAQFWTPSFTNISAAAFQIAIWELVYDTGRDLSSGNFFANPVQPTTDLDQAIALAQQWLSSIDDNGPKAEYLIALSHPDYQDQITIIPEPSTLIMWGGLAAMAIGLRSRRKRPTA